MKIPLPDQIEEAERHRDALAKAVTDKPHLMARLDRTEAIILTLTAYEVFEADILQQEQERNTR